MSVAAPLRDAFGEGRLWSLTLLLTGVLLTGLAVAGYAVAGWPGGRWVIVASAVTVLTWLISGAVTAYVRPALPFGWLLLAGGLLLAISGALSAYAGVAELAGRSTEAAWVGWVGGWIFFPHLAAMVLVYLLFPAGRLPSRRWRAWPIVTVAACVSAALLVALTPGPLATDGPLATVSNPVGGVATASALLPVSIAAVNLTFLVGLVALRRRIRAVDPGLRPLIRLVFWLGTGNLLIGAVLVAAPADWAQALGVPGTLFLTAAICAGLIWGRLWDVRRTVGRVIMHLVLTAIVVAVFVGTVTASGLLFGNNAVGIAIAALAVCLILAPLQHAVRSVLERMLYGRRRHPYEVLSALGSALETAGEPAEGLQRLTELVASSLRLPWVSVELSAVGFEPVAHTGDPSTESGLRLPLQYQGSELGALVVGYRPGETDFAAPDRRLLEDLSRQAGAAAHGISLTAALRQHRADLVAVREEERRRLRRDLHDGVASTLTAVGLKTEVAADLLPGQPERSGQLLADARAGVAIAMTDLRRVIDDLGPATLADLGLDSAINLLGREFTTDTLTVTTYTEGATDDLPLAIESAAFWIATEALHNVSRHAHATRCAVTIDTATDAMRLTVSDNGTGIADPTASGLGLASMRRRVEEVGGSFWVGPRRPAGTTITATFPITARTLRREESSSHG